MTENWKEQYHQYLLEDSFEAMSKSLDLKNEHLPQKLYRYRSVTRDSMNYRLNEIENGTIFLSHPKDFNDKSEARTHLNTNDLANYHKKQHFEEEFKDKLSKKQFAEIFDDSEWYKKLMDFSAKQDAVKNPERVNQEIEKVVWKTFENLVEEMNILTRKMIRIASFTTDFDNLSMWDRYANNHQGICLEYDIEHLANIYQRNRLFPVFYKYKMADMLRAVVSEKYSKFHFFEFIAMHKTKYWSDENEWRLIYNPSAWFKNMHDVPDEFLEQGKNIYFARPSKLLLGMDIKKEHEKILRIAANSYGIPVQKAVLTAYGLTFSDAN